MPTDDDKNTAGLRFEGEARRLHLRRPRLDRDGLYLFGRRYAAQVVTIGEDDLRTLRRGRVIAVDVLGEYLLYLRLGPGRGDEPASTAPGAGKRGCREGGRDIPQRECPVQPPSDRVRAVAARVRLNADKRTGVQTPAWIKHLAQTDNTRPGGPIEQDRGDGDPFDDAVLVANLRELLGARLTAYLASADTTRTIRKWADRKGTPSYDISNRLRFAHRLAMLMKPHEPRTVIQVWFVGQNPGLEDASPAWIIRDGDLNTSAPQVLDAAKRFIAHG